MSTPVTRASAARSSSAVRSSAVAACAPGQPVFRLEEPAEPLAIEFQQPDRQLPAAGVVGEHDEMRGHADLRLTGAGGPRRSARAMRTLVIWVLRDAAGMRSGRCSAMYARSRSRALCRLARAAPGDSAIWSSGLVRVVIERDGAPLPGREVRDGRAQRGRPVEVVGRRHGRPAAAGCSGSGHSGSSAGLGAPLQVPADVEHDAGQPAREPVRIPQPVQRDERLQERLLHDVVHVAAVAAEAGGTGTRHRLVPLDQQPERDRVAVAGQPDQVTVGDVHRPSFRSPAASSGERSATRPGPARVMPNLMSSASSGTRAVTSWLAQSLLPETVTWRCSCSGRSSHLLSRSGLTGRARVDDLQAQPGPL